MQVVSQAGLGKLATAALVWTATVGTWSGDWARTVALPREARRQRWRRRMAAAGRARLVPADARRPGRAGIVGKTKRLPWNRSQFHTGGARPGGRGAEDPAPQRPPACHQPVSRTQDGSVAFPAGVSSRCSVQAPAGFTPRRVTSRGMPRSAARRLRTAAGRPSRPRSRTADPHWRHGDGERCLGNGQPHSYPRHHDHGLGP